MNYDELSWFNQQLAAMLREGLPLEGALRQLTESQQKGALREEFTQLESALASGQRLDQAILARRFPPLYVRLVQAGARSGDLPGALTMAADYYSELNSVWRRAKAVLFYPAIVLLGAVGLTLLLWRFYGIVDASFHELSSDIRPGGLGQGVLLVTPLFLALVALGFAFVLAVPGFRRWLVWRLPGFREARTASFAGGMALMLRQGCPLPEALALMAELEKGSPAGFDLRSWQEGLQRGETDMAKNANQWRAMPPMLGWFLRMAGADLGEGFRRAAVFYRERAIFRLDLILHGALPALLLFIGWLVAGQVLLLLRPLIGLIDSLGSDGTGG